MSSSSSADRAGAVCSTVYCRSLRVVSFGPWGSCRLWVRGLDRPPRPNGVSLSRPSFSRRLRWLSGGVVTTTKRLVALVRPRDARIGDGPGGRRCGYRGCRACAQHRLELVACHGTHHRHFPGPTRPCDPLNSVNAYVSNAPMVSSATVTHQTTECRCRVPTIVELDVPKMLYFVSSVRRPLWMGKAPAP